MADIKEFGTAIQSDTSKALESVAASVSDPETTSSEDSGLLSVNSIKQGLSKFASGVSEMAHEVAREFETNSSSSDALSPAFASSISEKLDSKEEHAFKAWLATFDMGSKQTEIATLLSTNSPIYALHQQLVPAELTSEEFWGRYFYKTEQAAKKEESRLQLLERSKLITTKMSESEFSWEDDDDPAEAEETKTETAQESETTNNSSAAQSAVSIEPPTAQHAETNPEVIEKEEESVEPLISEEKDEEKKEEPISEPKVVESESSPIGEKQEETQDAPIEKKAQEDDVFDWN